MTAALDRIKKAAAIPGHLALWAGLYVASALLCLLQTTDVPLAIFSDRSIAGYTCALATAVSVYLLDRVKVSDQRLDPADREAKPGRFAFLHSRRRRIRGIAALLAIAGLASGWMVHPLCVVLVLGSFAGILVYAGQPAGQQDQRPGRIKDLFLIKNLVVAGSITAFVAGVSLLGAEAQASRSVAEGIESWSRGHWEVFAGGAALLFGRIAADAALCDIDDEAADRRFGTRTLPTRIGREATWLLALGLGAALVAGAVLLPAPPQVRRARILWTTLALASGVVIRLWNPARLRDLVDIRFVVIAVVAAAIHR